jgi:hypothetical protein
MNFADQRESFGTWLKTAPPERSKDFTETKRAEAALAAS